MPEPSHMGAPEVPEPLALGAQYLTRFNAWEKFVRATRPALVCASPNENFIVTGLSSLKGAQLVRNLWLKSATPTVGGLATKSLLVLIP